MRKSRVMLAGFAAAVVASVPLAAAGIAQASVGHGSIGGTSDRPAQSDWNGCRVGYACMYTDNGWINGTPEHAYLQYRCYNLRNETGDRVLFNNQTGGATMRWYSGYNCSNRLGVLYPPNSWGVNITPVNSISLNPGDGGQPPK